MRVRRPVLIGMLAWCGFVLLGVVTPLAAQQATVGVPLPVVSDSFYEHYGIGWGFGRRFPGGGGYFFNNGGGGGIPAFGGFDPNAGARLGFGGAGPGGAFGFGFSAAQGADRSFTSTTPFLTLPNGGAGSLFSGEIRPFVTGVVPVVGDGGPVLKTDPLTERLRRMRDGETPGVRTTTGRAMATTREPIASEPRDASKAPSASVTSNGDAASTSTAEHGDLSVREIRRRRDTADDGAAKELEDLVARGSAAEADGRPRIARIYYEQALRRAAGETAAELKKRLDRLK